MDAVCARSLSAGGSAISDDGHDSGRTVGMRVTQWMCPRTAWRPRRGGSAKATSFGSGVGTRTSRGRDASSCRCSVACTHAVCADDAVGPGKGLKKPVESGNRAALNNYGENIQDMN